MRYFNYPFILVCIVLISGCTDIETEKGPEALFDMAHGEIFSPNDGKPASYTKLYHKFILNGFHVNINKNEITAGRLSGTDVLILAGPMRELGEQEISSIKEFVINGGSALVLVHISTPVNDLVKEFGITISEYIVQEEENQIGSSQDFFVMEFEGHPITEGIEKLAFYGSWSLMSEDNARTIARTSKSAWSDVVRNRKFDPDHENREKLGMISATEYGAGKVVVIADDAVFIDMFINKGDNDRFCDNIIEWFAGADTGVEQTTLL